MAKSRKEVEDGMIQAAEEEGWLKPGGIIQVEVPSSDWLMPRLVNAFFRWEFNSCEMLIQGDTVLREVARVLRHSSREIDEPARYGGEEMAVALPQTDLDGAYRFADGPGDDNGFAVYLAVGPKTPAKTIGEFISLAKARPGGDIVLSGANLASTFMRLSSELRSTSLL